MKIPIVVLEELASEHEVDLRIKLEQSGCDLVSLKLHLLCLLLLFKFRLLLGTQFSSELLISLLSEATLTGIFFLHQLVLDSTLARDAILVFIDPDLSLGSNLVLINLTEFVFTLNQA